MRWSGLGMRFSGLGMRLLLTYFSHQHNPQSMTLRLQVKKKFQLSSQLDQEPILYNRCLETWVQGTSQLMLLQFHVQGLTGSMKVLPTQLLR